VSPLAPIRNPRPTRTTFKNVCAWFAEKWKAVTAVLTVIASAVYLAWAVWQPVDGKLHALDRATAATQSIRAEIDARSAARDAQFSAVTKKIEDGANDQKATTAALAVTNTKLDATNTRLDDFNRNLDTLHNDLRAFMTRDTRTVSGNRWPPGYVAIPESIGPPAPGREQ
jgi:predicted negative regulator of RcsB-dependent stress response